MFNSLSPSLSLSPSPISFRYYFFFFFFFIKREKESYVLIGWLFDEYASIMFITLKFYCEGWLSSFYDVSRFNEVFNFFLIFLLIFFDEIFIFTWWLIKARIWNFYESLLFIPWYQSHIPHRSVKFLSDSHEQERNFLKSKNKSEIKDCKNTMRSLIFWWFLTHFYFWNVKIFQKKLSQLALFNAFKLQNKFEFVVVIFIIIASVTSHLQSFVIGIMMKKKMLRLNLFNIGRWLVTLVQKMLI